MWVKRTREGKGGRWSFSEGKSGSFMYFTSDRRLIVKTIDASEFAILRAHAPQYVRYMVQHPPSFLTRFFGLYSITMYNTSMSFVATRANPTAPTDAVCTYPVHRPRLRAARAHRR